MIFKICGLAKLRNVKTYSVIITCFPAFVEHWTSFQAFCRYINSSPSVFSLSDGQVDESEQFDARGGGADPQGHTEGLRAPAEGEGATQVMVDIPYSQM